MTGEYRIGATPRFVRELRGHHTKSLAVRSHIESFMREAYDPFSRDKRPENLSHKLQLGERYSIRLNDDFRIIFDKIDPNLIIYRAIGKHDPSYRTAEQLHSVDLKKSISFPIAIDSKTKKVSIAPSDHNQRLQAQLMSPTPTRDEAPTPNKPQPDATSNSQILETQQEDIREIADSIATEPCVFFESFADIHKAMTGELEEWMLFLPKEHQQLVTQSFNGPSRAC
jgi:Txe/YoeB family toxin of Txe-Axe toxin-antitoxin module